MTKAADPVRPLDGVLVVALEQAVAAPLCSSQLANAGARVIKLERAEGDFARAYDDVVNGESAYFLWLNAGKESVRIDLNASDDRALVERLIAQADIFIQNLAPGATVRKGFGSQDLRKRHPRLITVDISGYGDTGDYASMKAYDLLVQGESGLASVTGSPDAPGRVGVSICDIACGMYAYGAVLEALLRRGITGEGSGVKVSLFDAAANWMSVPLLHYDYGGVAPARVGLSHPSIAPYGEFQCAGGTSILVAVQNQREWRSFCASVLEQPSMTDDPRFAENIDRVAHRTALDTAIKAIFGRLSDNEVARRLRVADIAFGRVNTVAGLSAHPQLRRQGLDTPAGRIDVVANPVQHDAWSAPRQASPALGQHDAAIRQEFGAPLSNGRPAALCKDSRR